MKETFCLCFNVEKCFIYVYVGKFLFTNQETDYEWGGDGTAQAIAQLTAMGQCLAKSCKRWRLALSEGKRKPYSGWKAVLYVERSMESGIKSLLEHGGAILCKTFVQFWFKDLLLFVQSNYLFLVKRH